MNNAGFPMSDAGKIPSNFSDHPNPSNSSNPPNPEPQSLNPDKE